MPPRDEFDDPEGFFARLVTHGGKAAGSVFENRSLVISGAVFISVVALSGVIWASYPSQNPLASDGAVPIIRADAEPYKYAPEDRGGMPIPHQDSTIFAAMRNDSPDRKVENLLSDGDEQPMDRQQLFAGLKTDLAEATQKAAESTDDNIQVAGMGRVGEGYDNSRPLNETERRALAAKRNREMLNQEASPLPGDDNDNSGSGSGVLTGAEVKPGMNAPIPSDVPDTSAVEAAEDATPEATTTTTAPVAEKLPAADVVPPKSTTPAKTEVAKDAAKPAATKPVEKADAAPKASSGGSSYVQVASVPDESKAAGEWAKLTSTLPMLSGQSYRVQTANIPGKGTFHRIQVGPMSKDDAVALCTAIKVKKPGGCLIAK